MTVATPEHDPVRLFRAALGPALDRRLNTTQTVVALIHAAVTNHGWTPKQLADECVRDMPADLYNPGAFITERLRKASLRGPGQHDHAGFGPKRPFCSPECRDNQGWVLDDARNPVRKCDCRTQEMTA